LWGIKHQKAGWTAIGPPSLLTTRRVLVVEVFLKGFAWIPFKANRRLLFFITAAVEVSSSCAVEDGTLKVTVFFTSISVMIFALSVLFYVPRKRECGTSVLKEGFFVRYVPHRTSEELEKEKGKRE
jgi:hypothetical protein